MSFFHRHHDRENIDINVTENINQPGAGGYQQPPNQQQQPPYPPQQQPPYPPQQQPPYPPQQQPPYPPQQQPPYQQSYSQVSETVEVIREDPYGNVEVDTITERVRPDGTVIVEEVRREGYNSGW